MVSKHYFSHNEDIEAVYVLWNYYKQNYLTAHPHNDYLELGIPQSLSYIQRRLKVTLEELNDFSLRNYGCTFSGVDSINPDKFGRG